jgi:hypothetical protein
MSWYQMNAALYAWVRAGEVNSDAAGDGRENFDFSVYELTPEERAAFDNKDIGAFYQLGLHDVLVNRYARAIGLTLSDYKEVLQPYAKPLEGKGRWQK